MNSRSPVEIFKSQVDAIAIKRDLPVFLAHFAPDCVFHDMTESEPRVGHDALAEYMSDYLSVMSGIEIEYLNLFGDSDFVAGEFVLRGLYRGEGAGAEGTRVTLRYCVVDEIRDGLVQSETAYSVPRQLEEQIAAATTAGVR